MRGAGAACTQNVIDACVRNGVGRLVYLSSYQAVFDGRTPMVAADEASTRYVTPDTCSEPYSVRCGAWPLGTVAPYTARLQCYYLGGACVGVAPQWPVARAGWRRAVSALC